MDNTFVVEIPSAGRRTQNAGDAASAASGAVREHITSRIRQPGENPASYHGSVHRVRVFRGTEDFGEFDVRIEVGGWGNGPPVTATAIRVEAIPTGRHE